MGGVVIVEHDYVNRVTTYESVFEEDISDIKSISKKYFMEDLDENGEGLVRSVYCVLPYKGFARKEDFTKFAKDMCDRLFELYNVL